MRCGRSTSEAFVCDSVLECGSYNVNGSVRDLFAVREYIGLDWRPGPGVDVVNLVHEYRALSTFRHRDLDRDARA